MELNISSRYVARDGFERRSNTTASKLTKNQFALSHEFRRDQTFKIEMSIVTIELPKKPKHLLSRIVNQESESIKQQNLSVRPHDQRGRTHRSLEKLENIREIHQFLPRLLHNPNPNPNPNPNFNPLRLIIHHIHRSEAAPQHSQPRPRPAV